MKKLYFCYANFKDLKDKKNKTIIGNIADSIEKAAYLLHENMKNINYEYMVLGYDYQEFSNKELNKIINEKIYLPILRKKFFKKLEFYDYEFYTNFTLDSNKNISELRKKYLKLIKKDEILKAFSEEIFYDYNYVYLLSYNESKFENLNKFLKIKNQKNNQFLELIERSKKVYDFDEENEDAVEEEEEISIANDKELLNSMYRSNFIKNHPNWLSYATVIDQLIERNDLYLTLLARDSDFGTFAEDNKHFIYSYLNATLSKNPNSKIIMFVRQFTTFKVPNTEIPQKRVGAGIFFENYITYIDKKEVEISSRTDNNTGKQLPKEIGVTYMNLEDLFKILKVDINN